MQIQHRPDVQQARGRMAIIRSLQAERSHERLQSGHVRGQILRAHSGVLDAR